jgi:hypothetical protein
MSQQLLCTDCLLLCIAIVSLADQTPDNIMLLNNCRCIEARTIAAVVKQAVALTCMCATVRESGHPKK